MKRTVFRYILSAAVILTAVLSVRANSSDKATAIMERCAAALARPAACRISFTVADGEGSPQGTLTFSGNRFMMETPSLTIWFDGKTQWTYLREQNEVNITTPTTAEIAESNPFELIRSFGSNFRCKMMKSAPAADIIELSARSKDSAVRSVVLTVKKSDGMPSEMEIFFSNGSKTVISIKSVTAVKVQDSLFSFSKKNCPGAEIVDLR